MQLKALQAF